MDFKEAQKHFKRGKKVKVEIVQEYLMSKENNVDGGEDRLILGPYFYGVADGATDKTGNNWGRPDCPRTGGAVLADIVKDVLENPYKANIDPASLTERNLASRIVEEVNNRTNEAAKRAGIDLNDVNNRADVGFAAYSLARNEVYHIHDCNFAFLMQDKSLLVHPYEKPVDRLTSALRTTVIKWYQKYKKKYKIDPFKDNKDLGREFILDLLKRQPEIQNNNFNNQKSWVMAIPYIQDYIRNLSKQYSNNAVSQLNDELRETFVAWCRAEGVDPFANGKNIGIPYSAVAYRTLNGFPTTIDITPVPKGTKEIILASDGFRTIKKTLEETLSVLRKQLKEDPHCIGVLQSTKGLQPGNASYDDRSYLRIKLKL